MLNVFFSFANIVGRKADKEVDIAILTQVFKKTSIYSKGIITKMPNSSPRQWRRQIPELCTHTMMCWPYRTHAWHVHRGGDKASKGCSEGCPSHQGKPLQRELAEAQKSGDYSTSGGVSVLLLKNSPLHEWKIQGVRERASKFSGEENDKIHP